MRPSRELVFDAFVVVAMLAMMAAMLYPFVYTISLSISRPTAVMAGKVRLVPVGFTLSAYQHVLTQGGLVRSFLVSAFYVVSGTASMLVLCSLLAYPVSLRVFGPRRAILLLCSSPCCSTAE